MVRSCTYYHLSSKGLFKYTSSKTTRTKFWWNFVIDVHRVSLIQLPSPSSGSLCWHCWQLGGGPSEASFVDTIDASEIRRSLVEVGSWNPIIYYGNYTSQVVVWGFCHQQQHSNCCITFPGWRWWRWWKWWWWWWWRWSSSSTKFKRCQKLQFHLGLILQYNPLQLMAEHQRIS